MVKGQVSLEFLSLSLVALTLIGISVYALMSVRSLSDQAASAFSFRSSATLLANAASEVCALGNGNMRRIDLPQGLVLVQDYDQASSLLRFRGAGNGSIVKKISCQVNVPNGVGLHGSVAVENKEGMVYLRTG